MNQEEIIRQLLDIFDGRDPLAEAHETMQQMDNKELASLVLIAANRIGTLLKGDDYEDSFDAVVHLCQGCDLIFEAYYNAWIDNQATISETGNA